MSQTYSLEQQIHCLSSISNAAFDLQEPSFEALQSLTTTIVTNALNDATIQGCIGSWELVWGPVVFSNNPDAATVVADNTMLLAYNADENQFVVAIAGTNAVSMYGWFQEDFGVNSLVEWESIVNKDVNKLFFTPSIAAGTHLGLQNLLNMQAGGATMLQQLNTYIGQNKISSAGVAVAGHSLGGALSPVMALYMQDTQSSWDTVSGGISAITAWPTAGPTPGDADFATYFQDNIGSNYTSRYNTIDVVPQAWMYSSMENIPAIYPEITAPEGQAPYYTTMGLLTLLANLRTIDTSDFYTRIKYQQITPWNAMTGTFDKDTNDKADTEAALIGIYATGALAQYQPYFKAFYQFLMQMAYQHTTAYDILLNIQTVTDELAKVKKDATGTSTDERRQRAMFTALSKYYGVRIDTAAIAAAKETAATA
ncbi:lipase family protein [Taibaiella helva]|uniref:lipase family protein n=1 Tax=Taibaiella helva TaxID=2301235 RepID=UPI000E57D4C0|nr:hypothetical protein [Taibaiella helva]